MTQGGAVPGRVVFDHLAEPASSDGAFLAATHAGAERALSELQFILSEARLNETSVAWLTCGAVATGPEEGVAGLSRAPLWGLVRSARAEHPDRQLQLLDVDAAISQRRLCWRSCCRRQRSRSWRCGTARWWRRGWCVRRRGRVHFGRPPERRTTELRSLTPVGSTE